jgi:hypothetical protein
LALILLAALTTLGASYWHVQPPYPPENEHERFGVCGGVRGYEPADLEALGASWYVTWGIDRRPPHPNGMAFLQTIPLKDCQLSSWLDRERVRDIIRDNPASVWQIGNEPDSIYMANCTPEEYARVYHAFYHLVKAEDPAAQVAFGGLVQATPLRMRYLDLVWETYQDLYNTTMPVDVWPLHSYILNEQRNSWGAEIPPGMDEYNHLATAYEIRDHDDMGIFTERIERFRQWMAEHDQRDKPLLVNEYGILMTPDLMDEDGEDFSHDRVIDFMYATFDYFRTATDAELGHPADGNRLVQAWAWYSLDDDVYHDGQQIGPGYGGDLFTGAYTKTMTPLGQAYADYVHNQVGIGPDYTDLGVLRLQAKPTTALWDTTGSVTLTVTIANYGRRPAQDVAVQFWEGSPGADGTPIGSEQNIAQVPGRYESMHEISVTWTPPAPGAYTLGVTVDPGDAIVEPDESNNQISRTVLVATDRVFLPAVACDR